MGVALDGRRAQLSESYLNAAQKPCANLKRTVEPLLVGAGFDDLVRQTQGFETARSRLADDLRVLATSDDDRRKVQPLLENLAAGNRALADARKLDGEGKAAQAFRRLDDFTRVDAAEGRIARRLGLGDCG